MERSADWMEQAHRDLAHGDNDLKAGYYEWSCFSAQQASEKALKAVLQRAGLEAWGHSLTDLLEAVGDLHQAPEGLWDAAVEVEKAYIAARYPDAHASGPPARHYTETEATRCLDYAGQILRFCQSLLPGV